MKGKTISTHDLGPKGREQSSRNPLTVVDFGGGKHSRRGPQRDHEGQPVIWQTTKVRPWVRKAGRRIANRIATASRKANR